MKTILVTIGSLLLISAAGIYHILGNYDPASASLTIFLLLYLFIIILFSSILTLIIFWLKIRFIDQAKIASSLKPSIRQSFLITACLIILYIMQMLDILTVWDTIPIILAFIFIELFFQAEKKNLIEND